MQTKEKSGFQASLQRLGSFLSGMVMPNIGAFIAWGVITALFIPDGRLPNEQLAELVDPMLTYLLPVLIGYTGGNVVYGQRGAVVGAIATTGAIVGSEVPMFIGAMIMGPIGGWVMKKFDELFQDKIRTGFEMLVNNFSAGLIGFALAILAYYAIGPVVAYLISGVSTGVEAIVQANLLPLANVIIEPAKVLFLNNALNHGIFTPLGADQVLHAGRSVLFLLETNPGPGLGVLLAFMFFGKGSSRASATGASIIHFFGGIHEIYFPYVMSQPLLFLAVIAGGMAGTFTFQLLGAGLTGAASPGSIIAITLMTPKAGYLPVYAGVLVGTLVSFAVAAVILRATQSSTDEVETAPSAGSESEVDVEAESDEVPSIQAIDRIIFACDAGMGSSAMGASLLRKKVNQLGSDMSVTNSSINALEDNDSTLIITQEELTTRARRQAPSAVHISVENFLDDKRYDEILAEMLQQSTNEDHHELVEEVLEESDDSQLDTIDWSKVNTIQFVYDNHKGSSVMAVDTLQQLIGDANVQLEIVSVDQMKDQDSVLLIATPQVAEQLTVVQGQLLVVDHYFNEEQLETIKNNL